MSWLLKNKLDVIAKFFVLLHLQIQVFQLKRWLDLTQNEIYFLYIYNTLQTYTLTIQYIDEFGGHIAEDKVITDIEPGTHWIEKAIEIWGYTPLDRLFEFDVNEDMTLMFVYFYTGGGDIGKQSPKE